MAPPFFRAKFRVPSAPTHFVPRPRLVRLLDELSEYPITVIHAPAGAGKTALVADWVQRSGRRFAWVRLDAADRDAEQLWASLTAQALGGDGSSPMTLVVDDVHRVDDEEPARAALASFVEHRPPTLRLVLLSRRRLPLPVERLRAGGELADVQFDLLRFSDGEAARMVRGLCPEVGAEPVSSIVRRADGWAAALQLMSLALRSQRHAPVPVPPGPGAAAPEKLLAGYLWQEVLGAEASELVGLLLRTAVVDRVNYGLAEALTGRLDAGDLLEEAEARGLFVTSLDAGGWFEVHSLVRDVLTATFRRRLPDGFRECHERAAAWFEGSGEGVAALDHWLAAERPREALRVLAEVAVPLVRARRTTTISRVLAQLPVQVTDPEATLELAWCRLMVDRPGFVDALATAELLRTDASAPQSGRLDVLRAAASCLEDDWRAAERLARRGVSRLGDHPDQDPIGDFAWDVVAHAVALGERWHDDAASVSEARRGASVSASGRLAFAGTRALGLALAGHPLDTLDAASRIRSASGGGHLLTTGTELDLACAVARREVGDPELPESTLEEVAGGPSHPFPQLQLVAQLELVDAAIADSRLDQAAARLRAAEAIAAAHLPRVSGRAPSTASVAPSPPAPVALARAGVRLSLAQADPGAAAEWLGRLTDPFWRPVCTAQVHLAAGRPDDAAEAVARAQPRCVRHEVVGGLVLARSIAHVDRDRAAKHVEVALELAAGHGLVRAVAGDGFPVLDLVEMAAWRVPSAWMGRLRRVLLPACDRPPTPTGLVDALTERERAVLRLLPSRLTTREIAAELFISQNTLKFHLRGIYRKLGASSRSEAVQAAHALRLLPRG